MIEVKLIDNNKINPERMANHAAKICYNSKILDINTEKTIDVENSLFKTSHHTTFEHQLFNFEIDNIAVADVVFGLHLTHPFYITDQRSGRYSKMYDNPNYEEIKQYIKALYNEKDNDIEEIINYIKLCYSIYFDNIDKATEIAINLLKEERLSDQEYLDKNARKIAQEQLRLVIPMISLTGLIHSIDLITLVGLYKNPFSPALKYITEEMKREVLNQFPELKYMFLDNKTFTQQNMFIESETNEYYSPKLGKEDYLKTNPECILLNMNVNNIIVPSIDDMIPVDKTYFNPKYLNNSTNNLKLLIEVSAGATMGQDQRHRTIKRTMPYFTGNFYLSPIIKELKIEDQIKKMLALWKNFYLRLNNNLFTSIAPYGAMVRYEKVVDVNALSHEQLKRLCWCAQEEIYNLNRILREQIEKTGNSELLKVFLPPCMKENGRCYEGDRWCRRAIKDKNNPCPARKV